MSEKVIDISSILPSYVERMPFEVKVGWMKSFNLALDQYGESRALSIANLWAMRKLDDLKNNPQPNDYSQEVKEKVDSFEDQSEILAKSKEAEFVSFKLAPKNQEMISYSQDGAIIIEAVLADNTYSSDGKRFTDEALISMAQQINENGMALPDIAHEEYNELLETSTSAEQFKEELKKKKGILKKVKALYHDGKLLIKAWLDKRYKRHVDVFKSLSIEAYSPIDRQEDDKYLWAEPLSFTFTNNPKISGANIIAVS